MAIQPVNKSTSQPPATSHHHHHHHHTVSQACKILMWTHFLGVNYIPHSFHLSLRFFFFSVRRHSFGSFILLSSLFLHLLLLLRCRHFSHVVVRAAHTQPTHWQRAFVRRTTHIYISLIRSNEINHNSFAAQITRQFVLCACNMWFKSTSMHSLSYGRVQWATRQRNNSLLHSQGVAVLEPLLSLHCICVIFIQDKVEPNKIYD